jgi:hypothetical protein
MAYQPEDLKYGDDYAQASQYAMMIHSAHEASKKSSVNVESRFQTNLRLIDRNGRAFWATRGEATLFIQDGVAIAKAGKGPNRAVAVAAAPP